MSDSKSLFGTDGGSSGEITLRIDVYQSGTLLRHARRMAEETEKAETVEVGSLDATCFATGTFLTAIAAVEGMLSEYAHLYVKALYNDDFLYASIANKYQLVTGATLAKGAPEVVKLQRARNALVHSEPENQRSKNVGLLLNKQGARWAVETVDAFARDFWGDRMPPWFRSDSGLTV
ncbi:MAG: hypothetical protein P4L84_32970 [Isosphaeraceae bacterium]|nr:hypothetical protein [Isosphaeraceae bacterium]